jgi:hypothetical protein
MQAYSLITGFEVDLFILVAVVASTRVNVNAAYVVTGRASRRLSRMHINRIGAIGSRI